jgi:hypothetical protein
MQLRRMLLVLQGIEENGRVSRSWGNRQSGDSFLLVADWRGSLERNIQKLVTGRQNHQAEAGFLLRIFLEGPC